MDDEKKSFLSKYKIRMKACAEKLSKRNIPLISSFLVALCLPWLLTFIILISSGVWPGLVSSVGSDGGLLFTMIIFYSFNYTFDLPLLGNGFWLVSLIWLITGLSLGFLTRDVKTSLISALFGLGLNFFLYIILINNNTAGPFLPTELIDPLLFPKLYSNFGADTVYFLFLQISSETFILPLLLTSALFSALLNPKLEKTTYYK